MSARQAEHAWMPLLGRRVLVVEDEALVAMMVEAELLDAGARVIGPAATLDDALRLTDLAAADGGLDAAVVDLRLQDGTAVPLADRLAARGVPFLFATGYADGCHTGCHAGRPILRKPFGPHQLVAAVAFLAGAWDGRVSASGAPGCR